MSFDRPNHPVNSDLEPPKLRAGQVLPGGTSPGTTAPRTKRTAPYATPGDRKSLVRFYLAVPRAVGEARRAAEQAVRAWGLRDRQADDVGLAVSEFGANACTVCPGAQIRLTVHLLQADAVQVELWDPYPALPQRKHPNPDDEAGRGLAIVEALASDYGTRPDGQGKTVFAVIPP